jgi:protein gp37
MSDFFIEDADQWRDRSWKTIKHTPWHQWQILTKRPERIEECLPEDWEDGYPNVWLGVTIESQQYIDRLEYLANVPAAIKFVSAEPLLGKIDFTGQDSTGRDYLDYIDWVVIGGESGNDYGKYRYRHCEVEWMEDMIIDIKGHSDTAVFVKQMGTYLAKKGIGASITKTGWVTSWHGADYDKFPQSLQIREWPVNPRTVSKAA